MYNSIYKEICIKIEGYKTYKTFIEHLVLNFVKKYKLKRSNMLGVEKDKFKTFAYC
ncbi:hypothetical protein C2G38_2069012 [Gigaspora rosea]|uniref:Uncharacterized protein n=1 Tax=Gigaspora rosea TaxID=44941 RepID=A0A397VSR6_9GLOM|nr:hypothetical protein C2G38_2069012 [Gigaspora rosea]